MKTIDIKGKAYIEVNERIKHFRENFKEWTLESEIISLDNGVCVIKATVRNPEGIIKATGHAYEKENSTFINKTSYIENCETSAWGRALGNLGIGIDTSIASAEEVLNASLNQKEEPFIPIIDNDLDLFEGLKACSDLKMLANYFSENVRFVKNQKEFIKIKNEMKARFTKEQ